MKINTMEEATKNSIITVGAIILGFTAFALFATYVPDDSVAKSIAAVVMVIVLILSAIWFTPLGNPLKRLYRKWKGIE